MLYYKCETQLGSYFSKRFLRADPFLNENCRSDRARKNELRRVIPK